MFLLGATDELLADCKWENPNFYFKAQKTFLQRFHVLRGQRDANALGLLRLLLLLVFEVSLTSEKRKFRFLCEIVKKPCLLCCFVVALEKICYLLFILCFLCSIISRIEIAEIVTLRFLLFKDKGKGKQDMNVAVE